MADYGLTPQGPNIKRLDVILEEMHSGLSEKWGVNTRQNPESLLNHLLTNVADAIADLWEFGEAVYFSQYPATAEGRSLDNAAQYGGSTRGAAAKSCCPIHSCGQGRHEAGRRYEDFLRDEPDNLSEYHGHERNQPYIVQSCLHQNRVPRNRECLHRSHQWRGVFL
ncbi:MAG: hypothetical protein ACLUGP_07620 [Faecalibacterium prausnitzii]